MAAKDIYRKVLHLITANCLFNLTENSGSQEKTDHWRIKSFSFNFSSNVTLGSSHHQRSLKSLQRTSTNPSLLTSSPVWQNLFLLKKNQPTFTSVRQLLIPSGLSVLLFVTGKVLRLFPDKQETFQESLLTSAEKERLKAFFTQNCKDFV